MTVDSIDAFFQTYVRAFARGDVDTVVECWRFPATITTPAEEVVLDEPAFRENTRKLCDFYRRQGMVEARATVFGVQPLSRDVVSVAIGYALYDGSGELIVSWGNGYLLREAGGALRVVAAVADAEIEAWAARGTPFLEAQVEGEPMLKRAGATGRAG